MAAGSVPIGDDGLLIRLDSGFSRHIQELSKLQFFIRRKEKMLNHITIMGRLVRDPELRRTASGIAVANFTVAVDRDFSGGDGKERETDFIDCVAWRQTGEFVSRYFAKGRMIVLSGRLQIRAWTDKEGNKGRSAEIVVDSCYFGDSKRTNEDTESGISTAPTEAPAAPIYGGYSNPAPASDFTMLEDDDTQQPF